jgi:NitT/TauT family transport system substrate-binding protein/putative hydroxymethylpyrimidine transport system substrate-binding protein
MSKTRSNYADPDAPAAKPTLIALAFTLAAALALAACGGDPDSGSDAGSDSSAAAGNETKLTLVLDFVPNAVHTGIYCALGRGYYEEGNLDLVIIEPSSTADTLRLIEAGEADLGIADGIDVADQISRGRDAKGVMALTQTPLGGLIALQSSGVGEPSDLAGRKVGLTGVPSDSAVLETMVRASGGDPARVETVTIGFNGVQALLNGRIDAFTGFVVADGSQVEAAGSSVTSFGLDEYGGPSYPGLVVFSTQERIAADPGSIGAFVKATVRGYEDTLTDPDR